MWLIGMLAAECLNTTVTPTHTTPPPNPFLIHSAQKGLYGVGGDVPFDLWGRVVRAFFCTLFFSINVNNKRETVNTLCFIYFVFNFGSCLQDVVVYWVLQDFISVT